LEGWVGKGETPLGLAVRHNSVTIIRILVKAGANPNGLSRQRYPLDLAAMSGFMESASALIKLGADVNLSNQFGTTALMSAAAEGHWELVQLLLEAGVDRQRRMRSGETANDFAVANRHDSIVKILMATTHHRYNRQLNV
jgi:ankyrin repeat protein